MSEHRESCAVAFGSASGIAIGTLLSRIYGPSYFIAAAFGVVALVALVIGVQQEPGE